MKINPEWEALEGKPYLTPLFCIPDQYKPINIGPPPKMTKTLLRLSATSFQRVNCLKFVEYNSLRQLRSVKDSAENIAATFGQAFHAAMKSYNLTQDESIAVAQGQKFLMDSECLQDYRNLELLTRAVKGYFRENRGYLRPPLIVNNQPLVEIDYRVPIYENNNIIIFLSGIIDLVTDTSQGEAFVRDYKTTSSWKHEEFLGYFNLSYQLLAYEYVVSILYPSICKPKVGIQVEGIFVQKSKPEPMFHKTQIIYPTDEQKASFRLQLDEKIHRIEKAFNTNQWLEDYTMCKTDFYCPFFSVCATEPRFREDILKLDYERKPE